MKNKTLIGLCLILISCSHQNDFKNTSERKTDNYSGEINSTESDTLLSSNKIFISILPSNKYLDSIQKVVPEDEWIEVASDNEYYRDLTEQFLKKKNYKLIDRPNKRFWQFRLKNGNIQTIDTLSLHDKWGNIIYNGKDSAFYFDGTIPEEELRGLTD